MATAKPPRKTATSPTAPVLAKASEPAPRPYHPGGVVPRRPRSRERSKHGPGRTTQASHQICRLRPGSWPTSGPAWA